jgi:exonuclease SbcC
MIKSLDIRNFQSHKRSSLEFDPGVNIVIGQSDSGKTAIIRALKKLVQNRPLGNSYRSTWGGNTLIRLKTTDNHTISFKEGDEGKEYILDDLDPFKAFATEVPKEIIDALNFDEINLQQQLDSVFLLSKTPGETAQHFNKIANLEKIALGQSNIKKWINQLNGEITNKEKDLKKNTEDLIKYNHLEKMEIDIESLEELDKDRKRKQQILDNLYGLLLKLDNVEMYIKDENALLETETIVNQILLYTTQRKEKDKALSHLQEICQEIKGKAKEIEKLKQVSLADALVDDLLRYSKDKKQKEDVYIKLKVLQRDITFTEEQIEKTKKRYNTMHAEFEENMGDICLLCGQPIKH